MKFGGKTLLIPVTLSMWATPLAADDYAVTASKVANAILEGEEGVQRDLLPPLKEEEYAELLKLAECSPHMRDEGGNRYLAIDWRCGSENSSHEKDRTTLMIFDNTGTVIGFAINGLSGPLEPTQATSGKSDLPSPRTILKNFGEAVISGGDATLGGLVELNSFDKARLARYADGHFRVSSRRYDGQFRLSLYEGKGRSSPSTVATLRFDEAGRPGGLFFAPTYRANIRSPEDYDRFYNQGTGNANRASQPGCSGIAC